MSKNTNSKAEVAMSSKPELVDAMWQLFKDYVPEPQREEAAREMCVLFDSHSVESYESDVARNISRDTGVLGADTLIQTLEPLHDDQYSEEARANRKWGGVVGRVLRHHDSHGLCYDVRHTDGSEATYDPDEIAEFRLPKQTTQTERDS